MFKTLLALSFLLNLSSTSAGSKSRPKNYPALTVEKLEWQIQDNTGQAQVEKAWLSWEGQSRELTKTILDLKIENGVLQILSPIEDINISIQSSLFKDLNESQLQPLNLKFSASELSASTPRFSFEKPQKKYSFEQISLTCSHTRFRSRQLDPIDRCLQKGQFGLGSFGSLELGRSVGISRIKVNLEQKKINFQAQISGVGTVRGEGTVEHDPTEKKIVIRVRRVRLGILDITGQFFDQIKAYQSEALVIQRPLVTFFYGKL